MSSHPSSDGGIDAKATLMKDRILTHMTNDHADSLALFLNNYCQIPVSLNPPPKDLKLDTIALDHIVIAHKSGRNLVKIDPPMKSFSESRERLVAMHKDCLAAMDLAEFKVEAYKLPNQAWQWLVHAICAVTFSAFILYPAADFLPSAHTLASKVYSLGGLAPALANLAAQIKDRVLLGMLAIHFTEAAYFSRTKLRKYWIPRFSKTWWFWSGTVFLGGVAGMSRFNDMVEGMKEEREKGGRH